MCCHCLSEQEKSLPSHSDKGFVTITKCLELGDSQPSRAAAPRLGSHCPQQVLLPCHCTNQSLGDRAAATGEERQWQKQRVSLALGLQSKHTLLLQSRELQEKNKNDDEEPVTDLQGEQSMQCSCSS